MLIKLLKYDLKYMIKNMSIFYILAFVFAILTRILFSLEQTVIISIFSQISVGCMYSIVASILINTLMRSWVRFNDSIYKDEGYLTNTLPVEKSDIYYSKFIQSLIFFIVSFLVIILCIFITYYSKDWWLLVTKYIKDFTNSMNLNTTEVVILCLLIIFVELFNTIQCGYFGLIKGNQKSNNRIGMSVFYGFIFYFIIQSLIVLILFISGLFNKDIMMVFNSNNVMDLNIFITISYISIISYIIIIFITSLICKKELEKGINLE